MYNQNEVANDVEINVEMVEKPINKVDCSFCLENLENTRILACSHIFCLSCLLQLEDKQMSGKIKCPICDTDNEIPPGGCLCFPTYFDSKNNVLTKFSEIQNDASQECPICYEDIKNPRFLPCFHKFCTKCVLNLEKKQDNGIIICPICRNEHIFFEDDEQLNLDVIPQIINFYNPTIIGHHFNQTNNEPLNTRNPEVVQQAPVITQNNVYRAQNNNRRNCILIVFITVLVLSLCFGLGFGLGLHQDLGTLI
jgi:hypothetical protein